MTEKTNEKETKIEKIDKKEIYDRISELTKKGETNPRIGAELKKQKIYNIRKATGKKISQIQKELKIAENKLPDDLMALIKKAVMLIKHKEAMKKDMTAKRGYQLTVSKINKLRNYYIKEGKIPANWRYSDEGAKLLVK
jgi:ribosomal protein S15P/S13E